MGSNHKKLVTGSSNKEYGISNWIQYSKEVIILLSLDLKIVEWNPIAEKVYRWQRKDVLGKDFKLLCENAGLKSPIPVNLTEILARETEFKIESGSSKQKYILSWTIGYSRHSNNDISGFILVAQDITRLKRTEMALRKAQEHTLSTNKALASLNRFVTGQAQKSEMQAIEYAKDIYDYMANIIAAMPGSVYWMNRQCVYLGCNDSMAKLFNLKSRHDIVGKTYENMYDKQSGDFYRIVDTEVMETGVPKLLEEPLYNHDGTLSIWLSNKTPLHDKSGTIIGMLGISFDITDRKEAELALKEAKNRAESANLAKSEFLAVISHEFRIPLTGILGMAKLLTMQNLSREKQEEYIQHISSAGMHLLNLINDTLDFSKLEAGKVELAPAPMNLNALIEETCTMLTPLSKAKNLELLIHFDQSTSQYILGDKRVLRQIIINLIGNAIKFTEQGYVSVQAECIEKSSDTVKFSLTISDTGIGIPEDKQGMIFDHFSQADASHSRRYGGAGLGLAITKRLVELMSGTIGVTSQVGQGSTFRCVIEFPLQKTSALSSPWMAHQSTVRILIVDDTSRGEILKRQLSPSNSQVVSGIEAFNALLASYQVDDSYDMVIIDQRLIDVCPFELARKIKNHSELKAMLVLLADNGTINTKELAKSAGYFECIVKPIQPLALQITLTAAWERWIENRN